MGGWGSGHGPDHIDFGDHVKDFVLSSDSDSRKTFTERFTQLNDEVACASLRVQAGCFVENGFGLGLEGKKT